MRTAVRALTFLRGRGAYTATLVVNDGTEDSAIGTYDVQLTVTDDEGQTSTAAMTTATVQDLPIAKRNTGGGAISLMFLWLLGFAALLMRRRSIGLRRSVGATSGSLVAIQN